MLHPKITTLGEEMRDREREEDKERDWGLMGRMVREGAWSAVSYDIVTGSWYRRSENMMWSSSGLNHSDKMLRCRTPT